MSFSEQWFDVLVSDDLTRPGQKLPLEDEVFHFLSGDGSDFASSFLLEWEWTYRSPAGSAGGRIRARGTFLSDYDLDGDGWYNIVSIRGQNNGVPIAGLFPAGVAIPGNSGFPGDNLVREQGDRDWSAEGQLTGNGFQYALADGSFVNVFFADFTAVPTYKEFRSRAPFPEGPVSPNRELDVSFQAEPDFDLADNASNILVDRDGVDVLKGRGGDDFYVVKSASIDVVERFGKGIDTVLSSVAVRLSLNVENLVLTGSEAIQGIGNSLNNVLVGNAANNKLKGKSGRDTLVGGLGKDILAGGFDDDTFVFRSIADSGVTSRARDRITDFRVGDRIDLSLIDANLGLGGHQSFSFIDSDAFTDAGQIRFFKGLLSVNVDDELDADFQVKLKGVTEFFVESLVL